MTDNPEALGTLGALGLDPVSMVALAAIVIIGLPHGAFDGAVAMGEPIGAKALSTAFMPPETTHLEGGEVAFRVPKEGAPYEPLLAHPTLDLWSFFVVLFRAIAHKPLIEMDDRDNLRSKREEMVLATWGLEALSAAIGDARAALARAPRAARARAARAAREHC